MDLMVEYVDLGSLENNQQKNEMLDHFLSIPWSADRKHQAIDFHDQRSQEGGMYTSWGKLIDPGGNHPKAVAEWVHEHHALTPVPMIWFLRLETAADGSP